MHPLSEGNSITATFHGTLLSVLEPDTIIESVAANWHWEVAKFIGHFEVKFGIPFMCTVFQLRIN